MVAANNFSKGSIVTVLWHVYSSSEWEKIPFSFLFKYSEGWSSLSTGLVWNHLGDTPPSESMNFWRSLTLKGASPWTWMSSSYGLESQDSPWTWVPLFYRLGSQDSGGTKWKKEECELSTNIHPSLLAVAVFHSAALTFLPWWTVLSSCAPC